MGVHTAFIKKLSVSADGKILVTVSDDKTARVWEASSGKLRHVLRPPIAAGFEGQLYAAAVSPTGAWVVVGGFTGLDVAQSALLYVFETSTGQLRGALSNLGPKSIENLSFSEDGSVLAICLADGGGIVFYDWQNQRVISRSTEPADKILGADSSAQGDFAITTIDGELWLYSSMDGYAHPRRLSLPVERPMHVQFSPDGKRLAVGFDGRPTVAIVDRTAWRIERLLSLPTSERQSGQHVVDWSADGKFLYSGVSRWIRTMPGYTAGLLITITRPSSSSRRHAVSATSDDCQEMALHLLLERRKSG